MSSQPLVKSLFQADAGLTDRILRPFRIVLAKLLRPMLWREEELIGSLELHLEQIQQQQRQLAALVRQVRPRRHPRSLDCLRRANSATRSGVSPRQPMILGKKRSTQRVRAHTGGVAPELSQRCRGNALMGHFSYYERIPQATNFRGQFAKIAQDHPPHLVA